MLYLFLPLLSSDSICDAFSVHILAILRLLLLLKRDCAYLHLGSCFCDNTVANET